MDVGLGVVHRQVAGADVDDRRVHVHPAGLVTTSTGRPRARPSRAASAADIITTSRRVLPR